MSKDTTVVELAAGVLSTLMLLTTGAVMALAIIKIVGNRDDITWLEVFVPWAVLGIGVVMAVLLAVVVGFVLGIISALATRAAINAHDVKVKQDIAAADAYDDFAIQSFRKCTRTKNHEGPCNGAWCGTTGSQGTVDHRQDDKRL